MKTILISEHCQMKPKMVGSQNANSKDENGFCGIFLFSNAALFLKLIPCSDDGIMILATIMTKL